MATFPKAPNSLAVFAHIADEGGTKPRHDFVPAGLLHLADKVQQFGYGKHYRERRHAVEVDPVYGLWERLRVRRWRPRFGGRLNWPCCLA